MKFIKLDLLTLLISLFLFASCENTSTIGLEIDPASAVKGTLVDTVTISSRTLLDETTTTYGLTRHPLGFLNDPVYGTTESSMAMAVNLPSDAYEFGKEAVLDSAILVLSYGGEFYGDSTANYNFQVHQLSSNIMNATSLQYNATFPHESTLLGSKAGRIFPTTPFKVTDVVVGAADTLKTVTPQVRIKLDNSFVQNNILGLSEATLKTNTKFRDAFKGLSVQVDKSTLNGTGGLMFFDFAGTNSALVLYYKKQNETTTTNRDTVSVNFPINNNSGFIAASIKHDYTGTPIQTQLNNPNQQYAVTYLQPLVGLRNKISFPYLAKFAANAGKMVVNKAELVIDLSAGSDIKPFYAAPRLTLYRYDIAEKREAVSDNGNFEEAVFGGYFDSVKRRYVFSVTTYIQDLITGKTKDYGTFLAPTPTKELLITPSVSSGARATIGSFKKNPVAGDNVMKLNIYYTTTN